MSDMTMSTSASKAAVALQHVALNEDLKAYVLREPRLYQVLLRAASRFIGGEEFSQCADVARDINGQGHAVTIDYMGESTRNEAIARQAADEFLKVVEGIEANGLNASVSLDLSHIGLAVDPVLAFDHACQLASAARDGGLEMMISAEGLDRTDAVLDMHEKLCQHFDNVGITLQAYLYRSPKDLEALLERPGKIRLVKGAFEAPSELAMPRGEALNEVYRTLAKRLFASKHLCSIATHDPDLLEPIHQLAKTLDVPADALEFEMLYGVTPERLDQLRNSAYRTRVYLPYGHEWHLYLFNRLAEYPPNIYQAIADAVNPVEEEHDNARD